MKARARVSYRLSQIGAVMLYVTNRSRAVLALHIESH
jgi:hypothetical protein